MDAGVTIAQTWNLIPGVALTDEQMVVLTTDIVWLVEKTDLDQRPDHQSSHPASLCLAQRAIGAASKLTPLVLLVKRRMIQCGIMWRKRNDGRV
ncbi:MAG: hypothetical protein IPJ48_11815 [Propionivibrio sp.]|uniref:Uncharacterized protein n=1 Tax=Candidatus Propionivibrio dominans TaxID=2954373 RepID=A0A9D7I929_9RHOO|nr:hypothetical protein [Candidatus Propionivibrio dominans]